MIGPTAKQRTVRIVTVLSLWLGVAAPLLAALPDKSSTDVDLGFAAGCEAVALPRRSCDPLNRAVPLVRALPLFSGPARPKAAPSAQPNLAGRSGRREATTSHPVAKPKPAVALIGEATLIARTSQKPATDRISKRQFGKLPDGTVVDIYKLRNKNGLEVEITNYGGAVVSLKTPDRRGRVGDIVLGYDGPAGYLGDTSYFGALIGRYANRIARGKFTLSGVEYQLAQNNGINHLHGGVRGFNKVVWQAREMTRPDGVALELTYNSKDGEEAYPGSLTVTATYVLTAANELHVEYSATTDKETIVNLTHHSYFNLAGAGAGDVLGHEVTINADRFTPVDETLIPTGELKAVKGTPFDFNQAMTIGSRINQTDEQLTLGKGYDHNFVLNKKGEALSLAATVYEPTTGRALEMWTTEPGMQLYTGNFLDKVRGKAGKIYNRRGGFCLEAQHFPDSPNRPAFPSTILKPGERYTQTTIYKFLVRGAK